MKKREEIDKKYTWNLDRFYSKYDEINKDIDSLKEICKDIASLKGKLNSSDAIFAYFIKSEKLEVLCEKIGSFLQLKLAINGKDKEALKFSSKLSIIDTQMGKEMAFISFELAQNSEQFYRALKKENRFADFDRDIDDIIRNRTHVLSEEKEKLLVEVSEFSNQEETFSALNDIDLKFDDIVMPDGTKQKLTIANYSTYTANDNQDVRKQAFENLHSVFASHNFTISTIFISKLKKGLFSAKQHNFTGTKQAKFYGDEMPERVVDVLVDSVNSHLKDYQKLFDIRKKALKLKEYNLYDNYAPIVKDVEIKPSYEESVDTFKKVVACLGIKYADYVDNQVKNRYVDVFETENKDGGAFNADLNICNPYVLLNYVPGFHWLGTLAHEFGHMVNTCLINDNQPMSKRGSTIFTAEIASTVNECLLYNYMESKAQTKQEKSFYIDKFLSEFNATVFRQTMFTEFELFSHSKVQNNEPIIYEDLNEYYGGLQQKYFGKNVTISQNAKFEWGRIPHFYRPFYVYSYATGFLSAVIIAEKIKSEGKPFVDKYIKFLSAGNSKPGIETLKDLGIDVCDSKTLDIAFEVYKNKISNLLNLMEEN